MTVAVWQADATVAVGLTEAEHALSLSVSTSSAGAVIAVADRLYDRVAGNYDLQLSVSVGAGPVSVSVDTPAVCSLGQSGVLDYVGPGVCQITATAKSGPAVFQRQVSRSVSRVPTAPNDVQRSLSGATGSLRKHMWEQALAAISGKTPGAATQDIFSAVTYSPTRAATPNTGLFVPGDFSHTAFQKLYQGNWIQDTLCHFITPHHAVFSTHVGGSTFASVIVRRLDGTFVECNSSRHAGFGGDLSVAYFDQAVTGINYLKLVPESFNSKVPGFWAASNVDPSRPLGVREYFPLPFFTSRYNTGQAPETVISTASRHMRIMIVRGVEGTPADWFCLPTPASEGTQTQDFSPFYSFDPWCADAVGGDSSSMVYALINGELAGFGGTLAGNNGGCIAYSLASLVTQMNTLALAAGEVSSNYSPTFVDISGFPNFG